MAAHLRLALLASSFAVAACSRAPERDQSAAPAPARPPDIVLLVVDTLRADVLEDPEDRYDTPNLDRLASEGVLFPRAFSAAPMTLPAHTSLFSSRPPFETGVRNNAQPVPGDLPLLAEWLAQHGYETRAVVSIATLLEAGNIRGGGPRRGFASYLDGGWFLSPAERTNELLRASLAERDPAKPLFLFAHFADPHEPYDAHGTDPFPLDLRLNGVALAQRDISATGPWELEVELPPGRSTLEFRPALEWRRFRLRMLACSEGGKPLALEWIEGKDVLRASRVEVAVDRGDRPAARCRLVTWASNGAKDHTRLQRWYALEVAHVDRAIGELRAELERLGLFDDGLVLFTADHGEALGERDLWGHVENLSDVLIRVPLIVRLPPGDARGAPLELSARGLVSHLDLVPTALELAGLPPLPGQRGRSLLAPRSVVHVAETHRPEAKRTQVALRDEDFKMVFFPEEGRFELYDLAADPSEATDVFAARASERPEWPERLRWIAAEAARPRPGSSAPPAPDEETQEMLRALGYAGD